jgi:hypothetical protein
LSKLRLTLFATVAVVTGICALPAAADQFDIGNTAACPNSVDPVACPYLYPAGPSASEVIGINSSSLTMFNHSGGDISTDFSQFLLIVGVPNKTNLTTSLPTISGITANSGAIVGSSGISWSAPIYEGQLGGGGASQSACDVLGFPNGEQGDCSSESYGNWAGADAVPTSQGGPGIAVSYPPGYAIFEYQISGVDLPSLNPDAYVTVSFNGSGLAIGDMVIAYGCETAPIPCKSDSSTPFTQSGVVTSGGGGGGHQVPEPASFTLLASGLALVGRRAFKNSRKR